MSACSSKPPDPPPAFPQRLEIRADARVELVSIVFRLAGAEEYRLGFDTPYRKAVDAHFAAFADHPAVTLARKLRREAGISYDAPISLVTHLDGVPSLAPIVPLSPHPPGLDGRWKKVAIEDTLAALRDFARDSDFETFWAGQAGYRAAVEERLRTF